VLCCELYNAALQERRDAYKTCRKSVIRWEHDAQLPAIKSSRPEFANVHSQTLQDVLERMDKKYRAFLQRGYGFPRFKSQPLRLRLGRLARLRRAANGW
jgi:putative transposase